MFSLQEFFGKDGRFFDLFEAAARETCNCADALKSIVNAPPQSSALENLRASRQRSKQIAEEISELAVKTFITILEREDLEALANCIYKIPKPIEKFAERYLVISDIFKSSRQFKQIDLIQEATQTVLLMIKSIRREVDPELIRRLNTKLQMLEAQADQLELELLHDLYKNVANPIEVIATRDLFDLLEKAIDRCRDAGNIVLHVCHKNS